MVDLKLILKEELAKSPTSVRLTKEQQDFINSNNINLTKLIRASIEEIKAKGRK